MNYFEYMASYIKSGGSGGSGIGGYCIKWDGSTAGRDAIGFPGTSMGTAYKVSDAVLNKEQMVGGIVGVVNSSGALQGVYFLSEQNLMAEEGWTAASNGDGGLLLSGVAGDYKFGGVLSFTIPSDGTYFFMVTAGDTITFPMVLCNDV
jgi:hypothetical protein